MQFVWPILLYSRQVKPGFHKANRELKQTDAAAERRQSTSKFLFRRTQGQVNSLALDIIHSLIERKFECDRLLSAAASVCLRLQLHGAIYRPDSFVLMPRYCVNLKAIRYESTSLNRIVADKSHRVIVA